MLEIKFFIDVSGTTLTLSTPLFLRAPNSRCQKDFMCTNSIWAGPDGYGAQLHMGLDHVVTLTYALSLLVHFRTGFIDDSGVLVMSWKLSAKSYIK